MNDKITGSRGFPKHDICELEVKKKVLPSHMKRKLKQGCMYLADWTSTGCIQNNFMIV
jgi:hypothetical protein